MLAVGAGFSFGVDASEQALLAARWTARAAVPLFLVIYLASSLATLWPGAVTRALLARRRQWGFGFAKAMTIHLVALAYNVLTFDPHSRPWIVYVGGGLAYALIFVMVLTSNAAAMRWLGRRWVWLHRAGIHYIWLIFAQSYLGRGLHPDASYHAEGWFFFAVMVAALLIRLYANHARRRVRAGR